MRDRLVRDLQTEGAEINATGSAALVIRAYCDKPLEPGKDRPARVQTR
jgi:hypothetical protein